MLTRRKTPNRSPGSRGIAARIGGWSTMHWKTAVFGWIVLAIIGLLLAGVGERKLSTADLELSHSGAMSPTTLARFVGMSTGGLSISLGRLEEAGYVRRTMDRSDRRRVSVELTRKAHQVEQQIVGPLLREVGELLQGYSDGELALISEFLQNVRGAVGAAGRPKG